MLKHILLISSFVFFASAMELKELHMMGPQNKSDKVSISAAQTELTRSYEGRQMGWVPAMYDASGLECMSRECFMVNALREIKERMTLVRCCPGLQDCVSDRPCVDSNDCESLFMGGNLTLSVATAIFTLVMGFNAQMPLKFPERLVAGSCAMTKYIFNYTQGMEWAEYCITNSMKLDKPCNVTAARQQFNQFGGPYSDASSCCYAQADPYCHKVGVYYNTYTYPEVYNQAQWDAFKPFMIACPAILAVQLGYIGSKKLRRWMRQRQAPQFRVAAQQPLLIASGEAGQEEV